MRTNKELYQSVFGTLHASDDFQFQEVDKNMRRSRRLLINRVVTYCLMAAAILAIAAGTAFAAVKLLTPSEVARRFGNEVLAGAFESEDAILIDESQEFEEYFITLLGMVSGTISNNSVIRPDGNSLHGECTNIIIAIERSNGEPFDITQFPFLYQDHIIVLPMISGFPDYLSTNFGPHTESQIFSDDHKVIYFIIELYNMEAFADHTLYIGVVTDGIFQGYQDPNTQEIQNGITDQDGTPAYLYDEETGLFQRNEQFLGSNALFELPVDPVKADQDKAQKIMDLALPLSNEELQELVDAGIVPDPGLDRYPSLDNPEELGELLEGTGQVLIPDEEGMVTIPGYTISYPDGAFAMQSFDRTDPMDYYTDYVFAGIGTGIPKDTTPGNYVENEEYRIDIHEVFTLNEDNTLTYSVYTKTTELNQPTTVTVQD